MCYDTIYLFRSRDTNNFMYERDCPLFCVSKGTVYVAYVYYFIYIYIKGFNVCSLFYISKLSVKHIVF